MTTPTITTHLDRTLSLGEGPFWAADEQALYLCDIGAPALLRFDPASGGLKSWKMPATIGSFGMLADGRAVVALRNGVHLFDPRNNALSFLVHPEPERGMNRLNDGKVGPDGRFWVGSMNDEPEKTTTGALYRIDFDGTCVRVADGFTISNGLAFSPDGRTLWHSDSRGPYVQTWALDCATGALSDNRRIITLTNEQGRPDGGACDMEGFYWSAGVSAGVLNRISPDGRIVLTIPVPVAAPTMPCFGGPDLKTLYVTSLTSDRLGTPQAGSLISLRVDVPGVPVARFGQQLR